MEKKTERKTEKVIGKYKAQFRKYFDKDSGDYVNLDIDLGDDLKKLLKSITTADKVDWEMAVGTDEEGNSKRETYKRYRVKRVIYSSFVTDSKDVLFICDLVDKGKVTLKFYETQRLDKVLENTKENIKRLIEVVLKYDEISQEVNYNID